MATKKVYDLAVKVGEYESNGQTKNRYKNIGAIFEKDDGGRYLALDSTIVTMELQYIANPKRSERLLVSLFEEKGEGGSAKPTSSPAASKPKPKLEDMEDDIPF